MRAYECPAAEKSFEGRMRGEVSVLISSRRDTFLPSAGHMTSTLIPEETKANAKLHVDVSCSPHFGNCLITGTG